MLLLFVVADPVGSYMEELTRKCDGLSLSAKEGEKLVLLNKLTKANHVLAAKYLTKRNLNVEAVARTFRPLQKRAFVLVTQGIIFCCLSLILKLMPRRFSRVNLGLLIDI